MKKVLPFVILFYSVILSQELFAMGSKKPKAPQENPPPQKEGLPKKDSPSLEFGAPFEKEDYLEIAAQVGPRVDDLKNDDELAGLPREKMNEDRTDQCFEDKKLHEYFIDQISYFTAKMFNDIPANVGFVGEAYGTNTDNTQYFPTSLIRHPLCFSTKESLQKTIKKIPAQSTIDKLNNFSFLINQLRGEVLDGDQSAKKELLNTWTKFFSCLAYAESLSSADSAASKKVAQKVSPDGYRKPAGVEFYEDMSQPSSSRLNIGMFQFTPNANGNIRPCLNAWNEFQGQKAACKVSINSSQSDLIKILGSSLQSFNAFCGVHKLIQTFAIQVNTSKRSATHPDNFFNGKLKSSEARCVTPHFYSGWAYNHFGPFQNSTGSNLEELFTCIEKTP